MTQPMTPTYVYRMLELHMQASTRRGWHLSRHGHHPIQERRPTGGCCAAHGRSCQRQDHRAAIGTLMSYSPMRLTDYHLKWVAIVHWPSRALSLREWLGVLTPEMKVSVTHPWTNAGDCRLHYSARTGTASARGHPRCSRRGANSRGTQPPSWRSYVPVPTPAPKIRPGTGSACVRPFGLPYIDDYADGSPS